MDTVTSRLTVATEHALVGLFVLRFLFDLERVLGEVGHSGLAVPVVPLPAK